MSEIMHDLTKSPVDVYSFIREDANNLWDAIVDAEAEKYIISVTRKKLEDVSRKRALSTRRFDSDIDNSGLGYFDEVIHKNN